ncbi:MAG: class IV adenylate cyclase [Acidobacteriota bacterium]
MAIEIEKKYRLGDGDVLRVEDALASVAADFEREEFEENTIYGGGVLEAGGSVLRIRKVGDRALLTYKKPTDGDSEIKHRVEYESEFSNVDELRKILANLGFAPRLVYEKRRKTWRFEGAEIVLDELPFGRFMEIEGTIEEIENAESTLQLGGLEVVHQTYPAIASALGVEKNGVIESRFTDKQ